MEEDLNFDSYFVIIFFKKIEFIEDYYIETL